MMNKSVIMLSGGLDSLVSLAICKESLNIDLALTFNYGQKAFQREYEASKEIARHYNIKHEIISLDWLKNLMSESLWVPNRNALFINIAACFADAKNYTHIIIGANKEESSEFKDNSVEFIQAANQSLLNSTNSKVQVSAPLIDMDKQEIISKGIQYNAPFQHLYSCYSDNKKHCGKCVSCLRLKRALELNNRDDIISQLF